MKICSKCVLPNTFPGIRFNEEGVCQNCVNHHAKIHDGTAREKYRRKFDSVLSALSKQGTYDAIMAYSGGKDSSYTLKVLKEVYHLRVLAVVFDHGFVSPQALQNIHSVTQALEIDLIRFNPSERLLCQAFRASIGAEDFPMKALQRASSICNTCMNLVKSSVLKTAIEMSIPLVVYGWSPGQAPVQSSVIKLNSAMLEQTQEAVTRSLRGILGDDLKPFLLQDWHFYLLESGEGTPGSSGFYNIHPLTFLPYDERRILRDIEGLGWMAPKDTDGNSTNCLLNGFANQVHLDRYGFHPYASEVATLVREGFMTREEGLAKLAAPADERVMADVKRKLGIEG
jgi:tRNA(Ile)-lysidine synthase TilS/MesJ